MTHSPLWTPSTQLRHQSHIVAFAKGVGFSDDVTYDELHQWSLDHISEFWSAFWDYAGVIGDKGDIPLRNEADMEHAHFFPQGRINWAENLLRFNDSRTAIIFRDELGRDRSLSFADVQSIDRSPAGCGA